MSNRRASRAGQSVADIADDVVAAGNCSGCGLCAQLESGLFMALDGDGFLRPQRRQSTSAATAGAVDAMRRSCPGLSVMGGQKQVSHHGLLGPYVSAWFGWSTDAEIRSAGSSGGVLTALATWMLEAGLTDKVVGATADADPQFTTATCAVDTTEARTLAGSRYAPVSNAEIGPLERSAVLIGKPCEASATRMASGRGSESPVLMSFFCAGVPSQNATTSLLAELGARPEQSFSSLKYRGGGWPGNFVAIANDGARFQASYADSWGAHLGPAVQWRCKLCPDGMGESADIVAGDFWDADERGYPRFEEADGRSAVVARTPRGHELLMRAVTEGVIALVPASPADIVAVQPLQRERRQTLAGRIMGARAAGHRPPRVRGFGLLRHLSRHPVLNARYAVGTYRRARRPKT